MKKPLTYTLTVALLLVSLTACGNQADDKQANSSDVTIEYSEINSTKENEPTEVMSTAECTDDCNDTEDAEVAEDAEDAEDELFKSVNETVYATEKVNIRESYSATSTKLGQLTKGQSVTRIGIGQGEVSDWSQVRLSDGTIAYINSKYISTTKPAQSTPSQSKPAQSTPSQSKPSQGTPSQGTPSQGGGSNPGYYTSPEDIPGIEFVTGGNSYDPDAGKGSTTDGDASDIRGSIGG